MKKIFTLLSAATFALQLLAAGGTASDAYLSINNYATIDEAGATVDGMQTIYKYVENSDGYWLTLSNYGVMKTDATQNWFTNQLTNSDNSSQYTTSQWTATDVFQGPSAYFGTSTPYSARYIQPAKTQCFYVSYCTQVKLLAHHRSNANYYVTKMNIYECTLNDDGTLTEGTTPIETITNSVIGTEVLASSILDARKIYKVEVSNAYAYLYEIAFKTPGIVENITAPVAYDVTDIEEQAAFMHWSACPGAESYSLRIYPCVYDGLTYRETFANATADVDPEDWTSLDALTDHPQWQGYGLKGADGGIEIENNGSLTSPLSNENSAFIPPYVRKITLKFKAKPADGVTDGELLISCGAFNQRFTISGPEKEYVFLMERDLNGSYDYMSATNAFFTFQNTYYYNPYSGEEEEDHRVILTNMKVYLGDYSLPADNPAVPRPKYIRPAWSGDTTFVHNIPSDSTGFRLGYYTNELGNQQIDMSFYNGISYWYYDVKAVYFDGQESEWSNQVLYTWAEKWPVILEDDDDPITPDVPGDVNGDGEVTSFDITALYNFLLNDDMSNIVKGDQNGDGEITSADVTKVYDYLLSN